MQLPFDIISLNGLYLPTSILTRYTLNTDIAYFPALMPSMHYSIIAHGYNWLIYI